ncbi:beta-N-acetylhexosaminidase [Deinobacterium chartae]|uniref:Beta-N-acetylhexosaminidase n=1 Tax=Deinobacterium chartae TaxID=521158 RepID=A0A841I7I1_9DEIO|nr:glycoside hydrolase family 3 protein [Deinobacterium chartae]MBB6099822.1 beta-N-acetylhexosaminidase [Deinobacterium chartae]
MDKYKLTHPALRLSPLSQAERRFLERYRPGGLCLFRGEYTELEDVMRLMNELYDLLGPETLISVDQEGGSVLRLPQLPSSPGAMALASGDDEERTYRIARGMARGLRALGFNVNLGPVLDINNNPANPVICERAFGEDPDTVTRHALAYLRAHQDQGIMAVGKHFPGHGDTDVDSHHDLPVLDKTLEELEATELRPFRAAFAAGLGGLMTAHIRFPRIGELPATLSPEILGYAREVLGFDGLIYTDALDMRALLDRYPQHLAAELAVLAGADAALVKEDEDAPERHARILEAFDPDPRAAERSLARWRRAVQRFPLRRPDPALLEAVLSDTELQRDIEAAAAAASSFTGRPPLPIGRGERVLLLAPFGSDGGSASNPVTVYDRLAAPLREAFVHLEVLHYDPVSPDLAAVSRSARTADAVVMATCRRVNMVPGELQLAAQLAQHPRAVHANLWNPYLSHGFPLPSVNTFGFGAASLRALAHTLATGEAPGRIHVA